MRCCVLLLILSSLLFAKATVVLHDALAKSVLRLQDIASIKAPKRLRDYVAAIEVPKSFIEDGVVEGREITKVLKKEGVATSNFIVEGRSYILFPPKRLYREDIAQFVRNRFASPQYTIRRIAFSLKNIEFHKPFRISYKVRSKTKSHIYVRLDFYEERVLKKSIPVTITIVPVRRFAIAKRDIPKGKVITNSDISWMRKNSYRQSVDPVGKVAATTIRKGRVIKEYMVEPRYAVRKRQNVTIIYRKGAIEIKILGLALQDGMIDDIIRVKNIGSGKVLSCEVVSPLVVRYVR